MCFDNSIYSIYSQGVNTTLLCPVHSQILNKIDIGKHKHMYMHTHTHAKANDFLFKFGKECDFDNLI